MKTPKWVENSRNKDRLIALMAVRELWLRVAQEDNTIIDYCRDRIRQITDDIAAMAA